MTPPTPVCEPAVEVRCAIYTRKSTEEGLGQAFNSLDAQRESAEAYIRSQQSQGWILLPQRYDDGGFSGANMDRPALRRLLADIASRRVDCVVVYKVDRLSRSLPDFARMMESFERHGASFVAVTQQFNTAASLGRLTLNILLSFAQFEREIIAERTRDKQAAARRKGHWTGGCLVLGYDLDPAGSKLRVNEGEAERVRAIFDLFVQQRVLDATLRELLRRGWSTKSWQTRAGKLHRGSPFREESLRRLLTNRLYIGLVRQGEQDYPGEHEAIVDRNTWEHVQKLLAGVAPSRKRTRAAVVAPGFSLSLSCAGCGNQMRRVESRGAQRQRYRYYVCPRGGAHSSSTSPLCASLPADDVERIVSEIVHAESNADNANYGMHEVTWAADIGELTIQLRNGETRVIAAQRVRTTSGRIALRTGAAGEHECRPHRAEVAVRVPRISRLVALALRLEDMVGGGAVANIAEVARAGNVTTERVRQILNLLDLAPDIQEQLLFLRVPQRSHDPVTEREMRRITIEPDWRRQRQLFSKLLELRTGTTEQGIH